MSQETYHVGANNGAITLSVAVSTPGIADTDPALIDSNGNTNFLNCISGPTGNLNNVNVGNAAALIGQGLAINTTIDLQSVASNLWPTLFNSLVVHYTLSGGADGTKTFTLAADEKAADPTGQFINASKIINLEQ